MPLPSPHLIARMLAWLVALAWLSKLIETSAGLRRVPNLLIGKEDSPRPPTPTLCVIVPARDEAPNAEHCLNSLLAQDCEALRIIAVDDRSNDATGAIMDRLAQQHPGRLDVIHIKELASGWLGKQHAMAAGSRAAILTGAPEYLLFTDADIFFAPGILRLALAEAQAAQADHLTVLPTTIARTAGEAMLLSSLQVLGLFAVRPWKVADPRARDALGVGAFNLLRTEAFLQLGGFEPLRMEIVEDLALARRVKRAGLRQQAAYAPGAVTVHWASGLVGVLHGMTKNLFAVFRFQPALLVGAAAGLSLFWVAPWILLFTPALRLPGFFAVAGMAGIYGLVSRRSLLSPAWFVTAPVAAMLLIYSMLRSMLVTLSTGGVTWRGTFYSLRELRKHSQSQT